MKKTLIPLVLSVVLFSYSCSKSKSDNCKISFKSIAGEYKIVSIHLKGSDGTDEDVLAGVPDCAKDDHIRFDLNGYLYFKDVGLVCDPLNNYISTWTVDGNTIHFEDAIAEIKSFNCVDLVIVGTETDEGVTYTQTTTFRRID